MGGEGQIPEPPAGGEFTACRAGDPMSPADARSACRRRSPRLALYPESGQRASRPGRLKLARCPRGRQAGADPGGARYQEQESEYARIRPEVPFVLGLGGAVVRGKIDLLAERPEGPLVVDYKTDALHGAEPAELAERYETQRDLYALAVHGARRNGAAAIVAAAYCFLEAPERTSVEIYDEARVAAARQHLERLVAGIRAGDFERTDNPHPALCYGCPAAARLCAKPAWRPQWAAASAS